MAQTTGAISSREFKIETSTDGAAWEDQSGIAIKITPSAGDRATGKAWTFDGDTPIVTHGKRDSLLLEVEFVYTEGASDLFADALAAYTTPGTTFYVRWHPKGGQTGETKFTSVAGVVKSFTYPPGDAAAGAPVICKFGLEVPSVAQAAN